MNRRLFSIAGAVAAFKLTTAHAQQQVVTNSGQIVSTGDVVLRQAAGGTMEVLGRDGRWTAVQAVGNDIQIVSTGNVIADQSAAGSQTLIADGSRGTNHCTPGEYAQADGCLVWCSDDGEWLQFCCQSSCTTGRC